MKFVIFFASALTQNQTLKNLHHRAISFSTLGKHKTGVAALVKVPFKL